MNRSVSYLAEEVIERDVTSLIAEYEAVRGVTLEAPISIEDIIEKHLKLQIEFDDMHTRHGIPRPLHGQPDILGAIYGDGSIFIDESLDPDENPAREGRYRFTLAHELGHWRLHQHLIRPDTAQASFLDIGGEPKFICRSGDAKMRVEWQADFYAACLLMPRDVVFAAWGEFFPDRNQRLLQPETPVAHSCVEVPRVRTSIGYFDMWESEEMTLKRFCKPLAERFSVSPTAMRIRLENLGLLHRTVPRQKFFAGS
jgi:Zn-dependent peptidase ImmA (M78 family)